MIVETPAGSLAARHVIVTLPTNLIARGAIDFRPALTPGKLAAAADLPLGAELQLFLKVEGQPFGTPPDHQLPTRYYRAASRSDERRVWHAWVRICRLREWHYS